MKMAATKIKKNLSDEEDDWLQAPPQPPATVLVCDSTSEDESDKRKLKKKVKNLKKDKKDLERRHKRKQKKKKSRSLCSRTPSPAPIPVPLRKSSPSQERVIKLSPSRERMIKRSPSTEHSLKRSAMRERARKHSSSHERVQPHTHSRRRTPSRTRSYVRSPSRSPSSSESRRSRSESRYSLRSGSWDSKYSSRRSRSRESRYPRRSPSYRSRRSPSYSRSKRSPSYSSALSEAIEYDDHTPPPVYTRSWRVEPQPQSEYENRIVPKTPKFVIPIRRILRRLNILIRNSGIDKLHEQNFRQLLVLRIQKRLRELFKNTKIYFRSRDILAIYLIYFPWDTNEKMVQEMFSLFKDKLAKNLIKVEDAEKQNTATHDAETLQYIQQRVDEEISVLKVPIDGFVEVPGPVKQEITTNGFATPEVPIKKTKNDVATPPTLPIKTEILSPVNGVATPILPVKNEMPVNGIAAPSVKQEILKSPDDVTIPAVSVKKEISKPTKEIMSPATGLGMGIRRMSVKTEVGSPEIRNLTGNIGISVMPVKREEGTPPPPETPPPAKENEWSRTSVPDALKPEPKQEPETLDTILNYVNMITSIIEIPSDSD